MKKILSLLSLATFSSGTLLQAQSNVIVDGTSGTNSTSTAYSTDGGLNLSLGFFADFLLVGGGGSGGTAGDTSGTGGGGAGGLLQGNMQLSSSNYAVAVGAGGVAPNTSGTSSVQGVNGTNSVFGNLTAIGGGGGGRFNVAGNTGGSGGGGGGRASTAGGAGTSGQGFAGGTARGETPTGRSAGGGGGGAGGAGGNGAPSSSVAGNGGAGLTNTITGTAVVYASGGGGGAADGFTSPTAGTGGIGGGGAGSINGNASNGTNGLGGGGGGAGNNGRGGNGGSGVVIVRYEGASLGNIGGTVTSGTGSATGYTIHTFTNTGGTNFNMSGVDLNARLGATLNGAITGSGNLTIAGPGTITLGASNSYAGTTTISSNTVRLADSGTFGAGAVTNNSAVILARTDNFELANDISGAGTMTQAGAGTATLSGNNTYGGNTTVNAGTLRIGNGGTTGSLGSGAVSVATNSTLAFNRSDNIEFDKALTGNGRLAQVGTGTTTLTGANAYTGGTVISSGALKVGNGGASGELGAGTVAISSGAALVYDRSDAVTLSNGLTGAGALRQSGAGTLTLSGVNTHSGGTVIDSGRSLVVGTGFGSTATLGSGAVNNNGTLVMNRGGFPVWSNNISGTGTLDVRNVASEFTLSGSNSYSGETRVRVAKLIVGNNGLSGSTLTALTNDGTGTIEIAALAANSTPFNIGGLSGTRGVLFGSGMSNVHVGGNNESTLFSGSLSAGRAFNKVGSGTLTLAGNSSTFNSGLNVRSGALELAGGSATMAGGFLVGVSDGDVAELKISSGSHSIVASGLVGSAAGSTGTVVMTGGSFSGSGYTTFIGNSGNGTWSMSAGTATLGYATLGYSAGGSGTLNLTGGQFQLGSGMDMARVAGSTAAINVSGGVLSNNLSGRSISMGQGTSVINLTGDGVLATKGIIVSTVAQGATINIGTGGAAGQLVLGSDGIQAWSSSVPTTLNFNHTNSAYVLAGFGAAGGLAGGISGDKLSVNQIGSGKTILTGRAAWGNGTLISDGTLQFGNGGALGANSTALDSSRLITNNGVLAFNHSGTNSLGALVSGSGSLVKDGTGLLYVSAGNTYSGETVINGGTLVVYGANRIGTNNSVAVNSNGTFALGGIQTLASSQTLAALSGQGAVTLGTNRLTVGASNSEFAGRISGAGGVTKAGEGIFTLSGSNSYKGDTIVNAGTLVLGSSNALGNASVVKVNSGGTLEASQRVVVGFVDLNGGSIVGSNNLVSALTLINSGSVSGLANGPDYAAGILKRTAGLATVDGANTYTGTTKIEAGTVQLVEGGSFAAGSSLFLQSGATMDLNSISQTFSAVDGAAGSISLGSGDLTVDGSVNSDFGGEISGSGKLIKSGAGTMTLTAAQSYSGGTEVTGGRLVGNTTSLTGAVANSATVELVENGNSSLGATVTGNGALVKSGAGTMTVANAQTYTGTTTVESGELKVNGSLAGAVSVQSTGTLGGSGSVGAISGSGAINPGNSPGILTAPSVDASGGLSFNFEFTSLNPTYSNATASLNDVLRLTGEAPFVPSLTSANAVNLYFNVPTFENGQVYTGGFFTDEQADFLAQIVDATFTAYVADENGTISYGGQNYSLLEDGLSVSISTTSQTADFAGGTVNGRVMQVQAVPEPSTYALLALAAAGLGAQLWRRRR